MHIILHTAIFSHEVGGGYREVDRDVVFTVDGRAFTVSQGTKWDGASIPKSLWAIYGHPFDHIHEAASLFHDSAYAGMFEGVTKEEADDIYRWFIRSKGQSWLKSWKEWWAVHTFGKSHWATRVASFVVALLVAAMIGGCQYLEAIPDSWKAAGIEAAWDCFSGWFSSEE